MLPAGRARVAYERPADGERGFGRVTHLPTACPAALTHFDPGAQVTWHALGDATGVAAR